MEVKKQDKIPAGYLHVLNGNYKCSNCWKFISGKERCAEMTYGDVVKPFGSCNLFSEGTPDSTLIPHGAYTKLTAGYEEFPDGYSCKRCEYYAEVFQRCEKVNEKSPGPDPGKIHADACCNNWEHDD